MNILKDFPILGGEPLAKENIYDVLHTIIEIQKKCQLI